MSLNATSWQWEFPGGMPHYSFEQHPQVTYNNSGTYSVTLTVFDDAGNSNSISFSEFITVIASPVASFTYDATGATVSFTTASVGATAHLWSFGDGSFSTEENPSHTYLTDGTYNVSLTVSNSACPSDTQTQSVVISTLPIAGFTPVTKSGCSPLTVQFTNSSSANAGTFQWIFPGGTPDASTDKNPSVTYNNPGAYSVALIVSNNAGSDTLSGSIFVKASPTAGFTYDNTIGTTVSFTNTSYNISSSQWDFGDGNTSNLYEPVHTYASSGTYTVTLTAANDSCGGITIAQTVTVGSLSAGVRYVKFDATGLNNGTSWADAYTDLQKAIDAAAPGDQIWVAKGVYKPAVMYINGVTNRDKTFYISKDVAIYGGFNGTENSLSQRDFLNNPTILSGDLDDNDFNLDWNFIAEDYTALVGDNAFHVVRIDSVSHNMRLDGFIITAGMSNDYGGGIYNDGYFSVNGSNPTIENCNFSGNWAYSGGGAIANFYTINPLVINCVFIGNCGQWGGAVLNFDTDNPLCISCTFSGNSAESGGAIASLSGSPEFINCAFSGNSASIWGGAVFNFYTYGPDMTNCTLFGNFATENGGAIFNYSLISSVLLTNCILWGNMSGSDGPVVFNYFATDSINLSYSLVDVADSNALNATSIGPVNCLNGVIYNQDPLFVDAGSGNLRLQAGSPAIDTGDNNALPQNIATDLDGNPRIFNVRVDIGAYEFGSLPPSDTLILIVGSVSGPSGAVLKIPVTAKNFNNIQGLQGTVRLAFPGLSKILGIEDAALTGASLNPFPSGQDTIMHLTWYSPTSLTQPDGDTLFFVLVHVEGLAGECKSLYLDGSSSPLKAYKSASNPVPVKSEAGSVCIPVNVQMTGIIVNADGSASPDVPVALNSSQPGTWNTTTDAAGAYGFNGYGGYDYIVRPAPKTTVIDPDCVDIGDAIALQDRLTGAMPYTEDIKIAADLDGNGVVDDGDLDLLMAAIGGGTFPVNTTWRFIALNGLWSPSQDPFVPKFEEEYVLPNLTNDMSGLDFEAVELGNINGGCFSGNKMASRGNALALIIEKEYREQENLLVYHLKAQSRQDVLAIQCLLTFDPEQMEFMHVEPGCIDEWGSRAIMQPQAREGLLPLIWYAADPETACRTVEDGTILFSLVFRTRQDTDPEMCALTLDETGMKPRVYDFSGTGMSLRLTSALSDADVPRLLPNQPNPFADQTLIPVFLPANTVNAEIRITDVYGREIAQIPVEGRGEVQVTFKSEGLTSGVYFYSLFVEGDLTASRRMIVQR